MSDTARDQIRAIKDFRSLVKYLRDELDWPIEADDFEELTFDYEPEELGIDPSTAAKIYEIKQLRPLATNQPWGIFFLRFEPKRLPVVVLRRILSKLVIKKRTSAKKSEQAVWNLHDLLFISNYGEGEERQITFAHFSQNEELGDLPTLKVLGWDDADTALHLDHVHQELKTKLRWPDNEKNFKSWREQWSSAFILRHREVITTSQELALRLADLAQHIRNRVNRVLAVENERGPIRKLYKAFQEALIHDLGEDDFADMYAQTIAYGLLAARFSRPMGIVVSNITDMVPNTNPFLRDMLSTFITTGGRQGKIDFDELGIQEVVELLNSPNTHMEDVRLDFGNRTKQEDPVIYFYELFLSEYDKKKKVERGVFYTPQPVVSYIVRSVHELLQKEFGLEDGLADITTWGAMAKRNKDIKIPSGVSPEEPFVQILDPAVGTATFLVEVIDIIHKTMLTKWKQQGYKPLDILQLWNDYVSGHLLPRLFGFELMMAPYAIAHMRLGLKLDETDYRFGKDTPRANIYLTNSLEPATDSKSQQVFELLAPALAHESKAVNAIKRNHRFTIIIGNPPYSGLSANMTEWAISIVEPYKYVDGEHFGERKHWLQDDYVKFIRFGQMRINDTGMGILAFITNHGYLDNPTFRGMRQSLLTSFNIIASFNLHGNINKREVCSDGSHDENVFDIQQGVAIGIFVKDLKESSRCAVKCADLWGNREENKYSFLEQRNVENTQWLDIKPNTPYYFFVPRDDEFRVEYERGWNITDIFGVMSTGIITARDDIVIDFNSNSLKERLADFADEAITDNEVRQKYFGNRTSGKYPPGDTRGWKLPEARKKLRSEINVSSKIVPCLYRPFDIRSIYYTDYMVDWPRPEVMRHMLSASNLGLCTNREVNGIFQHVLCTNWIISDCTVSLLSKERTYLLPLYLFPSKNELQLHKNRQVNLKIEFINLISDKLRLKFLQDGKGDLKNNFGPEDIFDYIYAIFHSPTYRTRYSEFLKNNYPYLPLPGSLEFFQRSVFLGNNLVLLHLMNSSILNKYITNFKGHIPSKAIEKITFENNSIWIDRSQSIGFEGIPEKVWNFQVGGYQVCEKWLKDRRGRTLSSDDINHYQKIIVALSETIKLMVEIDKVIVQHGGWPGAFA